MKKIKKYSVYKSGLRIGDLVTYDAFLFTNKRTHGYKKTSLVLNRKLLFKQDTSYGIKSFYEYEMMDFTKNNKHNLNTIKTQNMSIKSVNTANKR
jgi:hypothetical protein